MLVHLLRFTNFASAFEAPWGMTQYGIAEAVGTGQDHVSRAARRLMQKGLVAETKRRVAGVQERRKVYHLTPEGEAAALALQSSLERTPVKIMEGGVESSIPLSEVSRLLGRKHTLIELARAIRPDGTLDREGLAASGRPEDVEPALMVPATPGFVGRTRELETLKRLIEERKMVILHGIPGIGKSSLAARLVRELRPPRPTFWYRFREWDTLRNLLTPFSEFLQREGRRKLRAYLASRQEIDLNAVCYLVLESVRELRALLVFDDVHKASESFMPCFQLLTEVLEKSEGMRALLTTRRLPAFYSRSEVVVKGLVAEFKLEGLDEEASSQLLRARNIAPAHHRRAYLLTGGHPLALELYNPSSGEAEERLNINKYIEEEIAGRLTPAELKVLRMASVHRCPVPAEGLLQDPELPYETLPKLVSRSLLIELTGRLAPVGPAPRPPKGQCISLVESQGAIGGKYDIHDFVRDFFYSRMNPVERRDLHREVARYYSALQGSGARLEQVHHTLSAGEVGEAAALLARHGEELLAAGHAEELKAFFEAMEGKGVGPEAEGLVYLRARVCDLLGDWDRALELYRRALKRGGAARAAEAQYHIGWIQQRRNSWREAEASFRRCLALSTRARDGRGAARAYHGLGRVLWRAGRLREAAVFCRRSIARARAVGDGVLEASAGIEMGRVLASLGRFADAERELKRSVELAERTGELSEAVRAKNCLAWEIYRIRGRLDEALAVLTEAEAEALASGSFRELGPIYHSMGEVWVRRGDADRAEDYFKKSIEIFNKLGDDHGRAFNYLGFGIVSAARMNWERAEEWMAEAVAAFERVNTPSDLAYALRELSRMWRERGDTRKARLFERRAERAEGRLRA